MLVSQQGAVQVGKPVVEGALVRGSVVAAMRGPKIIVFKKKKTIGYRRTNGHRQDLYRVRVDGIEA
jgi:large subunit ribosomal protein L21